MIRIILMILSITIILYAWQIKNYSFTVLGACLFILALIINMFSTYVLSKKFRDGEEISLKPNSKVLEWVGKIIENIIIGLSFIGTFLFREKDSIYLTPILIIWIGTILVYILHGIIAQFMTDLPIRLHYGSWKIYRSKKNK